MDQTLKFSSSDSMCVDVAINDDSVFEDTETFQVTLSSSDNGVITEPLSVASIIVSDDDCKYCEWCGFKSVMCWPSCVAVEVSLEQSAYEVIEGAPVSVCVGVSGEIERNVVVRLATSDATSTDSASGVMFFLTWLWCVSAKIIPNVQRQWITVQWISHLPYSLMLLCVWM